MKIQDYSGIGEWLSEFMNPDTWWDFLSGTGSEIALMPVYLIRSLPSWAKWLIVLFLVTLAGLLIYRFLQREDEFYMVKT